jgi:hypothetical protein
MAHHNTYTENIHDIFAPLCMRRLTGWQNVKQETNFTYGPVCFSLTIMKYGINSASRIVIICQARSKNHELLCTVI